MNKQLLLKREVLKIQKEMLDMRGKKFAKLFTKFAKLWAKEFERQANEYIEQVENNPHIIQKADDNFEEENLQQLAEVYLLGQTLSEEAIQTQLTIGLSMDILNEEAIEWSKTRVGEMIKGINETTQKEVQSIITDAMTNGKTLGEIKTLILDKFAQYSEYRATLIAVMETGNALEQGKKAQFAKYQSHFGIIWFKRSRTQWDDRVRITHLENERAGWIPANNVFPWTWTDISPHGFNCRCSVSYSLFNPDEEENWQTPF